MEEVKERTVDDKEVCEVIREVPGRIILALDEEGREVFDWRKDYVKEPGCMLLILVPNGDIRIKVILENGRAFTSAPGEYTTEAMFHVFKTNTGARYIFEEDESEGESAVLALINYQHRVHAEEKRQKSMEEAERREAIFIEHFLRHLGLF